MFSAIVYFILFVICHWLLSIYGNTFTLSNNWIIKFIKQKFTSKTDRQSRQQIVMESFGIRDESEKYQELQEPLIAVDDWLHNMHLHFMLIDAICNFVITCNNMHHFNDIALCCNTYSLTKH